MIKILSDEGGNILRESSTIKIKTLEEQLIKLGFEDYDNQVYVYKLDTYLDLCYDGDMKYFRYYANGTPGNEIYLKTIQDVKTFIEYFKYYPESK